VQHRNDAPNIYDRKKAASPQAQPEGQQWARQR